MAKGSLEQEPVDIGRILNKEAPLITHDEAITLVAELIELREPMEETSLLHAIARRQEISNKLSDLITDDMWPSIIELIFCEPSERTGVASKLRGSGWRYHPDT